MTPLLALKPTRHDVLAECAAFYDVHHYLPRVADIRCLSPGRVSNALSELRAMGYIAKRSGFRSTGVTLAGRVYLALIDATFYDTPLQARKAARNVYPTGLLGLYATDGRYSYSRIWHKPGLIPYDALDTWNEALPKGWRMAEWNVKDHWWPYWTPEQRKAKDAA